MIPAAFDYHRPGSLDEAVALLQRHGDQAKVLSGGMSLLPTLKLRLGAFEHLVDIGRIPGARVHQGRRGFLRIGGETRQATLERSDLIRSKYPILADAVPLIADPLVRNRGTIGGNVANGDPANDEPAIMHRARRRAGGARAEGRAHASRRTGSTRTVSSPSWRATRSSPRSAFPCRRRRSGGAYRKLKRKTGDYAAAAVAVQLTLRREGCRSARRHRAHQCRGPTPLEAVDAAQYLTGKTPDEKTVPKRRASPRRRRTRAATIAAPPNTNARWRAS